MSTVAGFSVVTTDPRAVSISGDGALSYTDVNYSTLTAATTALYIASNGDVPLGNLGSVTVNTNGALTGGNYGILAFNYGSGALSITADGDVTGTNYTGILARNSSYSTDLDVTTGTGTAVTGGYYGIYARNAGTGALSITADGDVEGTNIVGISALNLGTDLDVTTGADTNVTGGNYGIRALNLGSGALSITADGDVEGTNNTGIYAGNSVNGTDLDVTTGADTMVTGGIPGIHASNYGGGALTVNADGDVTGTINTGILARNSPYGTDLGVTTGADTTVTGGTVGIFARNYGSGALSVTADGDVEGTSNIGIYAVNNAGTDLGVTTGAGTNVTGGNYGIRVRNYGTGALSVTADGDVEGTNYAGIFARNSNYGTDLSVTTGADTNVTGGNSGIFAQNYGSGALTVTADGDVEGHHFCRHPCAELNRWHRSRRDHRRQHHRHRRHLRHFCPQLRQRRAEHYRQWRCHWNV